MSLQKIILRNFQSHRKTILLLDPHCTVLSGKTGAGKSAALRGFRWLALNRPTAQGGFVRWGAKGCGVEAVFGKLTVRRRRGKANLYALDGKDFRAFGAGVPDEIASALRLDDLNFQLQIPHPSAPRSNPLFWFALSPGEVSRELNSIVRLDVIDRTLGNLAAARRRAEAEAAAASARLREARRLRDETAWAEEAAAGLERLGERERALAGKRQDVARLAGTLQALGEAARREKVALRASRGLRRVLEAGERAAALAERVGRLAGLLDRLREAGREARELDRAAADARADLERRLGGRCPLCGGDYHGEEPSCWAIRIPGWNTRP